MQRVHGSELGRVESRIAFGEIVAVLAAGVRVGAFVVVTRTVMLLFGVFTEVRVRDIRPSHRPKAVVVAILPDNSRGGGVQGHGFVAGLLVALLGIFPIS